MDTTLIQRIPKQSTACQTPSGTTLKPQGPVHFMMYRAPKLFFPNGKMSGSKISTKIAKATVPENKTKLKSNLMLLLLTKEPKKMLKEIMVFFVLQLKEIVLLIHNYFMTLIFNTFERHLPEFQFSVLVPTPGKFNSLYRASGSLKIKK